MGIAKCSERERAPLSAALISMSLYQRHHRHFAIVMMRRRFDCYSDAFLASLESAAGAGADSGAGEAGGAMCRFEAISRMRSRSVSPISAKTLVKVSRNLSSAPAVTRATESRD